jgi:short-subunit dehydrogenase
MTKHEGPKVIADKIATTNRHSSFVILSSFGFRHSSLRLGRLPLFFLPYGASMPFQDRIAVITGASSGIGWEMAKELARRGCHVGLIARRRERLEALAVECQGLGVRAAVAAANVVERHKVLAAFQYLREALGPVDLLIANSGVGRPTPLEPMDMDSVDNMIRVNYLGVVYAIEGVLPEMLQRGKGHIAAVSSLASYKGIPGESGYCSSKAAVNVYLEGLRIQLRDRGIAVTTVCPGFIKTPMTDVNEFPMPFVMNADRAAVKIVNAIARKKKVYDFPWTMNLMMRSLRWMPDWLVARIFSGVTGDRPQPAG